MKEKNKEEIRSFLKGQNLENKVKLLNMQDLFHAIKLNEMASPYFADFASKKKIELL